MTRPGPYAVHPQFFIEARDVSDFVTEFGPYTGRYVSEIPKAEWMKLFRRHLDELSPVERKRVIERLEGVQVALTEVPRSAKEAAAKYESSASWHKNIARIKDVLSFKLIVGSALEPGPFPTWVEALDDIRASPHGGWNIRGRLEDYLDAIEPLLVKAPAAYVIDYCFEALGEGEGVLKSMLDRMRGSRCYELHVIVRDKKPATAELPHGQFKDKIREIYADSVPGARRLFFYLYRDWPTRHKLLKLHSRYFLTRYGALEFGYGFQKWNFEHPQIPVNVVAPRIHKQLVESYIHSVTLGRRLEEGYPYAKPDAVFTFEIGGN